MRPRIFSKCNFFFSYAVNAYHMLIHNFEFKITLNSNYSSIQQLYNKGQD